MSVVPAPLPAVLMDVLSCEAAITVASACLLLLAQSFFARTPRPFAFYPPKPYPLLIWLTKYLLMPLMLRLEIMIASVEIREEDKRRLENLKGQRVVLTPNHPEGKEPYIMFYLSRMLGDTFNYISAREVFEYPGVGWFIQGLGAYSVARGMPDRSSFRMTSQLLEEGRRWLVIFPEGVVCGQGDTLMPFQQGTAQLAFWAYDALSKKGDLPPIYFVPMAIKYIYLQDMHTEIEHTLLRLEGELFPADSTTELSPLDRLRRVGKAVLAANEQAYAVRPAKDATLDGRIQTMREFITSSVEAALHITSRPDESLVARIRDCVNTIDQGAYAQPEASGYLRNLYHRRQQEVQSLYEDVMRVHNFASLDTAYLEGKVTTERFMDVLALLELEVFGHGRRFGAPGRRWSE